MLHNATWCVGCCFGGKLLPSLLMNYLVLDRCTDSHTCQCQIQHFKQYWRHFWLCYCNNCSNIAYISITTERLLAHSVTGFITIVIRAPIKLRPCPDAALNCKRRKERQEDVRVHLRERESEVMRVYVCVCGVKCVTRKDWIWPINFTGHSLSTGAAGVSREISL